MNCPHCGAAAVQPAGYCGACGQAVTSPTAPPAAPPAPGAPQAAWSPQPYGAPDPTAAPLSPPVDPYASAAPFPPGTTPAGPPAQPYGPPPQPYGAPTQPYGVPTQPYGYGAAPQYGAPPPYGAPYPYQQYVPPQSASIGFSVTAFVLAGIAVFFVPIVFGVAAIVFGSLARKRGERLGPLALKLAIIGTLVGFFFGALVRIL